LMCTAAGRKASVHADFSTLRPSTLFKPSPETHEASRHFRIVLGQGRQHGDPANSVGLLRARRERPRCRAAEQRDELASPHIEMHLLPQPGTPWAAYRIGEDQVSVSLQCEISTRLTSESGQKLKGSQ